MKKCKHKYENVLMHAYDAFWGPEFFPSKRCQLCGKTRKGKYPVAVNRFLSPDEILDAYITWDIIEDADREPPNRPCGRIESLGDKYELWWQSITDDWDGYVIYDKEGNIVKHWIAKERK